ncbi:MAG: hypothetical protein KA368_17310 [Acidobacteria bacterium]|nr:hypothetical protein [Acidobacteriota bacterium]
MIRKMTKTVMFAMFVLSLMVFTASAQKENQSKETQGSKAQPGTSITKKETQGATAQPKLAPQTGKKESVRPSAPERPIARLAEARPTITIHEVTKKDAAAKPNPNGAGRLVPVDVRWDAKLPEGAKLHEIKAILKTKNTDGQSTVVEQSISVEKFVSGRADGGTIMLPMPEGVFAKEFTLTMKGKFRVGEKLIDESVTKSGTFR